MAQDGGNEGDRSVHDDGYARCEQGDLESENDSSVDYEGVSDDPNRRPGYATRPSPLVQPIRMSPFTLKTIETYGVPDLAHEWVMLFQAIGGNEDGHRTRGVKNMKVTIPDTVFLSPSGQPSMWYATTASMQLKVKNMAYVTPRAIFEAFRPRVKADNPVCAIERHGFQVRLLRETQLQELCHTMESPRLASTERNVASPLAPFCLQRFIASTQDVTFICIWKQQSRSPTKHGGPKASSPRSPRTVDRGRASPTRKRNGIAHDDVFLLRRTFSSDDGACEDIELVQLGQIDDDDDRGELQSTLSELGFDAEVTIPHIFHMKLLTAEIVSRVNRTSRSGDRTQQVECIACEMFVSATTQQVHFSGLAGIKWQDQEASWETHRGEDLISQALCQFADAGKQTDSTTRRSSQRRSPRHRSRQESSSAMTSMTLGLFHELNPRFPSVEPPQVAEKQWKYRSALVAPHISPRYIGAEIPKMYRDGQFQPLLTSTQSDSVNRMHLSSREVEHDLRHALSRKYADVEREQWSRVDKKYEAISPRRTQPATDTAPRSPRAKRHSMIKEELI